MLVGHERSWIPWLQSLVSGVIGALLGSAIAGIFTWKAAKSAKGQAYDLFEKASAQREREDRDRERRAQVRTCSILLEELNSNTDIAMKIINGRILNGHASLATDAWQAARISVGLLDEQTSVQLATAYRWIGIYNDGVLYERYTSFSNGIDWMEASLKQVLKQNVLPSMRECSDTLIQRRENEGTGGPIEYCDRSKKTTD